MEWTEMGQKLSFELQTQQSFHLEVFEAQGSVSLQEKCSQKQLYSLGERKQFFVSQQEKSERTPVKMHVIIYRNYFNKH